MGSQRLAASTTWPSACQPTSASAEGFLARQVAALAGSHLESYEVLRRATPGPQIPGLDSSGARGSRPTSPPANLAGHPARRLPPVANVLFEPRLRPELAAIVDWELCTIGDPLLDLGWLLATWPDELPGARPAKHRAFEPWDGFPDASMSSSPAIERAAIPAQRRCGIAWFEVLACFKLGIILEGTHARACAGKAPKATGDILHATTVGLFEQALRRIAEA